jgi:hypothetical protein
MCAVHGPTPGRTVSAAMTADSSAAAKLGRSRVPSCIARATACAARAFAVDSPQPRSASVSSASSACAVGGSPVSAYSRCAMLAAAWVDNCWPISARSSAVNGSRR